MDKLAQTPTSPKLSPTAPTENNKLLFVGVQKLEEWEQLLCPPFVTSPE